MNYLFLGFSMGGGLKQWNGKTSIRNDQCMFLEFNVHIEWINIDRNINSVEYSILLSVFLFLCFFLQCYLLLNKDIRILLPYCNCHLTDHNSMRWIVICGYQSEQFHVSWSRNTPFSNQPERNKENMVNTCDRTLSTELENDILY